MNDLGIALADILVNINPQFIHGYCCTALQIKNSKKAPLQSIWKIPIYKLKEAIELLWTSWTVTKKKCDTNEDKSKSMMCALYVQWYAKRRQSG